MNTAEAEVIDHKPTRAVAPLKPATGAALTPMGMLNHAVNTGAGIEVIGKLMDLQERWDKAQARKAFDKAIAAAKADITPIVRNAKGHNEKRYADFAAIARTVDPIISKHGLSYRFRTVQADRISVTCVLSHEDGHYEETTLAGPADTTGNKNAIQAIGSTLTYLQRYSLVQALGLAAANDDDGKGAGSSGESGVVTDEQAEEIKKRILEGGVNIDRFLKHFKIESVPDLPAAEFDNAKVAIANAAAKVAASKKAQS